MPEARASHLRPEVPWRCCHGSAFRPACSFPSPLCSAIWNAIMIAVPTSLGVAYALLLEQGAARTRGRGLPLDRSGPATLHQRRGARRRLATLSRLRPVCWIGDRTGRACRIRSRPLHPSLSAPDLPGRTSWTGGVMWSAFCLSRANRYLIMMLSAKSWTRFSLRLFPQRTLTLNGLALLVSVPAGVLWMFLDRRTRGGEAGFAEADPLRAVDRPSDRQGERHGSGGNVCLRRRNRCADDRPRRSRIGREYDRLPLLGWSGDLRAPHFLGIHAMQALPVIAAGAKAISARRTRSLFAVGTMNYGLLTAGLLHQALRSNPIARS